MLIRLLFELLFIRLMMLRIIFKQFRIGFETFSVDMLVGLQVWTTVIINHSAIVVILNKQEIKRKRTAVEELEGWRCEDGCDATQTVV